MTSLAVVEVSTSFSGGHDIISMPHPAALKTVDEAETAAEQQAAAKDAAQ